MGCSPENNDLALEGFRQRVRCVEGEIFRDSVGTGRARVGTKVGHFHRLTVRDQRPIGTVRPFRCVPPIIGPGVLRDIHHTMLFELLFKENHVALPGRIPRIGRAAFVLVFMPLQRFLWSDHELWIDCGKVIHVGLGCSPLIRTHTRDPQHACKNSNG